MESANQEKYEENNNIEDQEEEEEVDEETQMANNLDIFMNQTSNIEKIQEN